MELNKIYCGDALQTLQTFSENTFDMVITSPPYNKMGVKGGLVDEVAYKSSSDIREENGYQAQQINVLNELYRVLKPGGHIFYNHKLRWVNGMMIHPLEWILASRWIGNLRQEIIWDRQIAGQLRGWRFWQVEERVFWMQKGITKGEELLSKHAKMTSIWRIRPESGMKDHPAPFPLELPTRCIYSIFDEQQGLNILDPYCGTGTTLVVASVLQHNYVGIDCSPEYIKLAENRIKNVNLLEFSIMAKEMLLHTVEETYQEKKKKKMKKS
jgi:site-specific DNA-methyltransferase (adenine-specific)